MLLSNAGAGLLNRSIDALPFELHIPGKYRFCGPGTRLDERLTRGEHGINLLDELCRAHDIAYRDHKDTATRHLADKQLADKAWRLFKSKDTPLGEKVASWLVTSAMNLKSRIEGGGLKRHKGAGQVRRKRARRRVKRKPFSLATIVKHAKDAIKGSGFTKSHKADKKRLRYATLAAVKSVRKFRKGRKLRSQRILPLPKSGGVLPLMPIFAGLSALGSLAPGIANIFKTIAETKDATRRFSELQRHNKSMEDIELKKGRGLFLKPHPKGGLGLYMKPYAEYAKNC